MAQTKMLLVLALLILVIAAESRIIPKGGEAGTLVCTSVHGTEDGDTCLGVAKQFSLSSEEFLAINPNINCDSIFIGQWLCVDGSQP